MRDYSYRADLSRFRKHWIAGLIVLCCLLPTVVSAEPLRIAVASNFSTAIQALSNQYEQQSGQKIDLIFGSSGKLYAQIINGAPFDAFFAADVERPERLEQDKRIQPDSRFTYAFGQLVLWSPDPALIDTELSVLSAPTFHHLAIANPRLAPYGLAAQQVLEKLALWTPLQSHIVRGENIGQTYQFIRSGNAELGFVALAQLKESDMAEGSYWQVPADLHAPIEQQAVQLTDKAEVKAFLAYVREDSSKQLIQQFGYQTP